MTAVEESFLDELHAFLSQPSVDLFFAQHPNALSLSDYHLPASWRSWWDWTPSQDVQKSWELLWEYYSQGQAVNASRIPDELRYLVNNARRLQLLRTRGSEAVPPQLLPTLGNFTSIPLTEEKIHGMSPKKAHEVVRTIEHLRSVLQRLSASGIHVKHVVDVGAGQVRILFAQLCHWTGPPCYKCLRYGLYIVHGDPGRMAGFYL